MSMIASFIRLPIDRIDGFRDSLKPKKKRWFVKAQESDSDYLDRYGQEIVQYDWHGYILVTLLVFLQEKCSVDLVRSEYGDLSETYPGTLIVLTQAHAREYAGKLAASDFQKNELIDYYKAFNETEDADVGEAMLDGVRALREALKAVDESSVILLIIG